MLIAAIDSFGYRLFFLLHILAIVVAFAPGFVWPFVAVQMRKEGQPIGPVMAKFRAANNMRVHGPALLASGIFGFALIGLSDKAFKFSQTWVSIALVLWFIMLGVLFALLVPAERKAGSGVAPAERNAGSGVAAAERNAGSGVAAAEQRAAMFAGMLHALLLLMLIDMIWKPGL